MWKSTHSHLHVAESKKVCSTFAEGSFQHLFGSSKWKPVWQQNHTSVGGIYSSSSGALLKMISTAYHNLCTSGMLLLPSEQNLRDYSNVVKSGDGFKMEVQDQLYNKARMGQDEIPAHRQIVGIAVDEIYIKSDLVYDSHSARLIGFVNLGAVDVQLVALEQSSFPAIATRVLTFMVRGIFYRLNFP